MSRLILASASPRRRELLTQVGYMFEVIPSTCEEVITTDEPIQIVEELSRQKAEDVYNMQQEKEGVIVIGADTIVVYEGRIMGKPKDTEEACSMLEQLQGKTHKVYTGVTLCYTAGGVRENRTFHECTEVTFYAMSQKVIEQYVETKEPMDKAGAYGIQGKGAIFVEKIVGDYNNVVGLPVARLCRELEINKHNRI